jgi:hypothetical protein
VPPVRTAPDAPVAPSSGLQYTPAQITEFVTLLEIPFPTSVIEWRVVSTSKNKQHLRGQVIPYADPRAYTDRLNTLFTPAGWTRKYTVHTSANFQRTEDMKTTAKVFVTCEVTIFGLGSHSATGEEWADDPNAGTAAEAQAFKRACSCFGLGRYLYHFTGMWMDLDDHKRPKTTPCLAGWATPQGWKNGLRPGQEAARLGSDHMPAELDGRSEAILRQIEDMAGLLGKGLYRGVLKSVAMVWNPGDIREVRTLERVLAQMQTAQRGLNRLEAAYLKTGGDPLAHILQSLGIVDVNQISTLEQLGKIVLALEAEAKGQSHEK